MGSTNPFNPDGYTVKILQTFLHLEPVDGIFGGATEQAVFEFQRRNGLPQDGIVGFSTWSKLLANRTKDAGTWLEEKVVKTPVAFSKGTFNRDRARLLLPMWNLGGRKKAQAEFKKSLALIEPYLERFHLLEPVEWVLFIAQLREETGPHFITIENLNYRCNVLPRLFSAYGRDGFANPWQDGRCRMHPANQVAIANNAYANRMGNGSPESGDGWRFRGGGGIQTTGFNNTKKYHDWLMNNFPDLYNEVDGHLLMENGADALKDSPHNVLSAVFYWVENKVFEAAKYGFTQRACNEATALINPYTHSKAKRWLHMQKAMRLIGIGA